MQIELHIEFKSDEDAEKFAILANTCEVICCAIALRIRKKLKEQILMEYVHSSWQIVIRRKEINFLSGSLNPKAL